MSETEDAVLLRCHHRTTTCTGVVETVEWQERCPTGFVFCQPPNGPRCIFIRLDNNGSHAPADRCGKGEFVIIVLRRTQLCDGANHSAEFSTVPCRNHRTCTAGETLCP